MNTYKVQAELFPPASQVQEALASPFPGQAHTRCINEVFTAPSDFDAIRAGVAWAKHQAKDYSVIELSVQRHPLPEADATGQLNYDYPDEFFEWSDRCLLPLDIFTHAFLQAATGLASPAQ